MNKIILLGLLAGCGLEIRHSGDATVHHKIEIDINFIEELCKGEYPDSQELYQQCVADELKKLMDLIESLEQKK